MRPRTVAPLLAAALAVAGCGGPTATPQVDAPAVATPGPSTDPAAAGRSAGPSGATAGGAVPATLRFTGRTLDGRDFDGAALAGKPAVLWFWAPWCPTCAGQAAGVADTARRFAGKVSVVGVAGLDDEDAMKRFAEERGVRQVPHLSDAAGTVWRRFQVTQQSTFVLLDSAGAVAFQGPLDGDDLAERVGRLS